MALGKSVAEVRALSYVEYRSWELFYILEPFGFLDREYRTAAPLAMLYNIHKGKNKKDKDPSDFMRDMPKEVLKQLKPAPDISEMSMEEKREYMKQQIKKDFGI